MRYVLIGVMAASLSGCVMQGDDLVSRGEVLELSTAPADMLPAMRWDTARSPEQAELWTRATLAALESHGSALSEIVPEDIATWCPGYTGAPADQRNAFWAGLFSALAKHESTWNPTAVGGGGRWFGLVQIAPATAQGYGCSAQSASDLKNGAANLSCAVRIASYTVARDGVVAAGRGGIAADWGPFASADKRADMAAWTSAQSYCQG